MKIKIIDMLVKIANRKETTKVKTKYDGVNWSENDFLFNIYEEFRERNNDEIVKFLNDYVEIIEGPKKIEKLNVDRIFERKYLCDDISIDFLKADIMGISNKINELIDEINNLKEKK